jgi:hypothetical protein
MTDETTIFQLNAILAGMLRATEKQNELLKEQNGILIQMLGQMKRS